MPPITALLHTANDALRLGRALETVYPCDEILVIDHHSTDNTAHIAREYGARVMAAEEGATTAHYLHLASYNWIFCLEPGEAMTEGLAASLFEWRQLSANEASGVLSVFMREETNSGWNELSAPQTRLVPRDWNRWSAGWLPAHAPDATLLAGELLRFNFP
jgi:hypothetical protein